MSSIFAIEDDLDTGLLLKMLLEEENHVVTLFTDPEEFLSRLGGETPDLIVSDIMLPKVDGYTLITNLLQDPRLAAIPVIMVTAKSSTRETFKSLPNVKAFLGKPYNKYVLVHMVERALQK